MAADGGLFNLRAIDIGEYVTVCAGGDTAEGAAPTPVVDIGHGVLLSPYLDFEVLPEPRMAYYIECHVHNRTISGPATTLSR